MKRTECRSAVLSLPGSARRRATSLSGASARRGRVPRRQPRRSRRAAPRRRPRPRQRIRMAPTGPATAAPSANPTSARSPRSTRATPFRGWASPGPSTSTSRTHHRAARDGRRHLSRRGLQHRACRSTATTGKLLWRVDTHAARLAGARLRSGWGIRGLALWKDKVIVGTPQDGRLVALDRASGAAALERANHESRRGPLHLRPAARLQGQGDHRQRRRGLRRQSAAT